MSRPITINLEAGNASIAELGKVLGVTGVNIRDVKREYDAATSATPGDVVPVVVTVADDRGFTLRLKTPPTSFLIKRELGASGASRPGTEQVGKLDAEQLRRIAARKLPDLNTDDIEAAMRTVAGTARSMGVAIVGR